MPLSANVQVFSLLDDYSLAIAADLHERTKLVAERVLEFADQFVPVDTGALEESLHVEEENPFTWTVVAGSEEVDYAVYVEYGTVNMDAKPYMTPAAEIVQGELGTSPGMYFANFVHEIKS